MAEYNFENRERQTADVINEMNPTGFYYSAGTELKEAYLKERLADNNKFKNPDSEGPEYINHDGFNTPSDLLEYIKELEKELKEAKEVLINTTLLDDIKEIKDKIKAKEEVLTTEELRELDPSYKALKRELTELESAKEELSEKMKSLKPKIADLKVTARKWIKDRKEVREEAFHNEINKIKRYKETLNVLKAEYQKVLNKYYNEPLTKQVEIDKKSLEDAIKYHESEIERLEKEVREGTHNINLTDEIPVVQLPSDKVTIKFNTNGVVENTSLYKPIDVDRGTTISLPPEPVLLNARGMNQIIEFEEWTLNGEPFDFSQPVNENITLDAKYKKFDLHSVSYYDENKKNLCNESVKHGDIIVNPKKLEDKNLKIFEKWVLENGDDFNFSEPITEPVVLYAKYKRNWKKIAAIGAGVITGTLTTVADQVLGTSLITSVTNLSSLGAAVLTNYKLKNHKTELKPTENLNTIKKASAKLVNYFRDNNNIINLRTFFKSTFASTLVGNVVNFVDNTINPEIVNDSSLDVNGIEISDLSSIDGHVPEIGGR